VPRLQPRLFFARVVGGELTPGDSHDWIQTLDAESLTSLDWLPADLAALPALTARLTR
jgi:hypothetical protein